MAVKHFDKMKQYRRKAIAINGIEVPAPLAREPKRGEAYHGISSEHGTYSSEWDGDAVDAARFAFGIWATLEDAEKVCEAIAKALKP